MPTISFSHGNVTLNDEQYKVVTADPLDNQRILAAAGSGKTTTITARIAWLLTNTSVSADQIVLLTFSRNSAREMSHRVRKLVGNASIWSGTFHSLANTILKQYPEKELGHQNTMFFIDELPVRWIQWMRTTRGRKWVGRIRYIVVDEFQDINPIQWRLIETMRHIGARAIIVGDDAQNIYTWRGSSTGFLLDFHKVVPSVKDYQLRINYRSSEAIVAVANRIMRGIPTLPWKEQMVSYKKSSEGGGGSGISAEGKIGKNGNGATKMRSGAKPDVLFFWRASDEYLWIANTIRTIQNIQPTKTIAILARNNVDLYRIEEVLVQNGVRTRFLVMENTHNETGEQGHIEVPSSHIIDLSTFHGSKGLEWDYTFLISLTDDSLPSRKSPQQIIGERRLFYVACTRARQKICMTYHGNERALSRFVREIGFHLLTFHGLAKYALSEIEVGNTLPNLQTLLDSLDGEDWIHARERNLLPWKDSEVPPIEMKRIIESGESWKIPAWADVRDFEAFVRLFVKRCVLQLNGWPQDYKDPLRERMIFTIRVFYEDKAFWEEWRDEIKQMAHHFFTDLRHITPVEYGDIEEWANKRCLNWSQTQIVAATTLLAKLRGQIRPLRFEKYTLDEFTIAPVHCVVPAEYRIDVLRSWRKFVNKTVHWKDILQDIWRIACLEQVAEGRSAGLFRCGALNDKLSECIPFLEKLEGVLQTILVEEDQEEIIINPEVVASGLNPVSSDILIGKTLLRISGEKRPDMYSWTETWLTAYLFVSCGVCKPIEKIQMLHPFNGVLWSYNTIDYNKAKESYQFIHSTWSGKSNNQLLHG